jgi:hypothetical protein
VIQREQVFVKSLEVSEGKVYAELGVNVFEPGGIKAPTVYAFEVPEGQELRINEALILEVKRPDRE